MWGGGPPPHTSVCQTRARTTRFPIEPPRSKSLHKDVTSTDAPNYEQLVRVPRLCRILAEERHGRSAAPTAKQGEHVALTGFSWKDPTMFETWILMGE